MSGVNSFANYYRIICIQLIKRYGTYFPAARALIIRGVNIEIIH
jgi:hypothetical protein